MKRYPKPRPWWESPLVALMLLAAAYAFFIFCLNYAGAGL